jgi:uroporphyrinogen-III decarboxylase
MLYQMMGYERFSIDYYEHRDLFDSLNDTMLKRYEELFDLAAAAPVEILLIADNITADVVGKERYRNYCVPVYDMLRKHTRGTDKKLAVHMDGRLASLKDDIGASDFDIVEGFTPSPVGDVSLAEARAAWPQKALWINFTSSVHVDSPEKIEAHTRQLLQEAGGKRGFAMGVTEDVPFEAMERSLAVISKVLRERG